MTCGLVNQLRQADTWQPPISSRRIPSPTYSVVLCTTSQPLRVREAYPLGSAVGAHRSAGVLVVSRSRDYVNRPSQQSLAVREFLSEDSDVLFRAAFFDT